VTTSLRDIVSVRGRCPRAPSRSVRDERLLALSTVVDVGKLLHPIGHVFRAKNATKSRDRLFATLRNATESRDRLFATLRNATKSRDRLFATLRNATKSRVGRMRSRGNAI